MPTNNQAKINIKPFFIVINLTIMNDSHTKNMIKNRLKREINTNTCHKNNKPKNSNPLKTNTYNLTCR